MDRTDVLAIAGFALLVAGGGAIAYAVAGLAVAGGLAGVVVGLVLLTAARRPEAS